MSLVLVSLIAFAVGLITLVRSYSRATAGSRVKLTYRRGNEVVLVVVDEPDEETVESMIAALRGIAPKPRRGRPRSKRA